MRSKLQVYTEVQYVAFFLVVFFVESASAAKGASPSGKEWAAWPEFCRAKYASSVNARTAGFDASMPQGTVKQWGNALGSGLWPHVHHACGGQIHLMRAKTLPLGASRDQELEKAVSNHMYTLTHASNQNKWYAYISVSLAQVYREMGEPQEALKHVVPMVERYPDYDTIYLVWSLILRDQDKFDEAARVLEKGLTQVPESGEIHYFLGLTYLDLGQAANSLEHAHIAYSLGYPLQGLKRRLQKQGEWNAR